MQFVGCKIKRLVFICLFFLSISTLYVSAEETQQKEQMQQLIKAKVLSIISDKIEKLGDYGGGVRKQKLKLKVLEGVHKGELIEGENNIEEEMSYKLIIKKGQEVLLVLEEDELGQIKNAFVDDLVRDKYLIWLLLIFVLLIIIVGGVKGIKSLITLGIISISIIKFMLPRILQGDNPVILATGIAIFTTIATMIIIGGFNKKTTAAIIGTIGGVICAGIIAYIFDNLANLTGLSLHESQSLMYIPQGTKFDFKGLLLAGIILGALGAVMDVSISIASSIKEIYLANPNLSVKELFKSGMNIGRDVMGTMSNTLILAYAGASMNLMLLFLAHDIPFKEIINMDIIASEIVRALAGTIGLVFTIPITAIISSTLYKAYLNK